MSASHFTGRPDPLLFYHFTISFPLGSRQEVFASRAAKPACRPAHFHKSAGPFTIYYFTPSFPLGSRQEDFESRAAKPACRPAIFTGRPDPLLFYYFTISFPLGSRQEVFAARAAKPACRPAHFHRRPDPLLFYHFTISFPLSSRQEVVASRAARPACRPAIFTSRPDPLLLPFYYCMSIGFQARGFCISGRKTCMSARTFSPSAGPFTITFLLLHFHWVPVKRFLHLGPQNLHVGPPFHRSSGPFTILPFYYFISKILHKMV